LGGGGIYSQSTGLIIHGIYRMSLIACNNCQQAYPQDDIPYNCPNCGGIFSFSNSLTFDPQKVEHNLPGIWPYRHVFNLPQNAPIVTLGEGNTPLVWGSAFNHEIAFKLEYLNPTGSFKDRGTALLVSFLVSKDVEEAVEDSSGNAGASLAAYATRVGLKCRVFVPDYASGPKRDQIINYGAEVVRILGPRTNAAEAVRRAADQGNIYASHAYLPQGLPGFSVIAYELLNQLGEAPGSVVSPVGQGSLLLGVGYGFQSLKNADMIDNLPALVGVQALACAPMWSVYVNGPMGLNWVTEGETIAEGVRIRNPLRGDELLQVVESSQGSFVAIEEEAIMTGRDHLARMGFYVEPTSAVVWNALEQIVDDLPEPIVVLLTGSGLKT
jgi:threonine synthase